MNPGTGTLLEPIPLSRDTQEPGRRPLGLEYDGPEHRTIAGQNRDHLRDADLDLVCWDTVRVSSFMIYDECASAALVDRVMRRVL